MIYMYKVMTVRKYFFNLTTAGWSYVVGCYSHGQFGNMEVTTTACQERDGYIVEIDNAQENEVVNGKFHN